MFLVWEEGSLCGCGVPLAPGPTPVVLGGVLALPASSPRPEGPGVWPREDGVALGARRCRRLPRLGAIGVADGQRTAGVRSRPAGQPVISNIYKFIMTMN